MYRDALQFMPALWLCTLILVAPTAIAATLTGSVHGAGAPAVGASVRILDLDRETRSGSGGQFSFSSVPKGTYHVVAGLIGHASQTNRVEVVGETAHTEFELVESAIPMDQIVVSASPTPRQADDLYQSAESKSRVAFLSSPGSSFAEKLSDLPGVNVRGLGSAPSRPVLRGLSDNRVLVLENGLRMGDLATYDPAHATPIAAVGIRQVDVVRGPASILFGPSTIGGVVNLITDLVPGVSERALSGIATIEGNAGNDGYSGYFANAFSGAHHAFQVSAGGVHAQNIHIPSGPYQDPETGTIFDLDRLPHSFDRSHEEGIGYAWQGDGGTIGIGAKHYEMNYGIAGVPPNDDWANVPPTTSRIAQRRNTVELRSAFGAAASRWKLDANFNDYNHSEFPTAQDAGGVSDPQANHFHKHAYNARLQRQHAAGNVEGAFGLWTNIEKLTIDGDEPLGPNSITTGLAGYVFEEFHASPRTRLQAGVRYDYNRIHTRPDPASTDSTFQTLDEARLSNAVTASLGVVRKFGEEVSGSISLARSFRAPTVQELFADGVDAPSGTFTVGTAGLKPEGGFGIDASLKGSFGKVKFEVSPYANFIQDYIYGFLRGDTLENFPVRQFAATDARLVGFEASVSLAVAPHVALEAASDFVRAEDTQLDAPLPFTPPLRGLLRAGYQSDRATGMIEWRLAAAQNRLGDGDTPTTGYGLLNLGVGLRRVHGGAVHDLSLHCDNVFDRDYRDHLSVIKDFLPQPGRAVRLNYTLEY